MSQANTSTSAASPLKSSSESPVPLTRQESKQENVNNNLLTIVEEIENAIGDLRKQIDQNEVEFSNQIATLEKQLNGSAQNN